MSDFPPLMSTFPLLQDAFGLLIVLTSLFFGLRAWAHSRGRLGLPVAIIGGGTLLGGLAAAPQVLNDAVSGLAGGKEDPPAHPATTTTPAPPTTTAAPSSAQTSGAPANSSSTQIDWGLVGTIVLVVIGVAIAACLIMVAVVIVRGRLHRRRTDRQAERHRRSALHGKWEQARSVFGGVREQRNSYLLDAADRLFTRPLLDDPSEPLTAAFLEAFEAADSVDYETCPYDESMISTSLQRARKAASAWEAASRHATEVGLGNLSLADRTRLRKARKLLSQAMDPGITSEHRRALVDRVSEFLGSVGSASAPPAQQVVADVLRHSYGQLEARKTPNLKQLPR